MRPNYLAIADAALRAYEGAKSAESAISPPPDTFSRLLRLSRTLAELEKRCPDHVDVGAWQTCISDGKRFLRTWGEQAEAFGWTSRDLFGLGPVPAQPHWNYRRLGRCDLIGLCWLLNGRPVVAITESSAVIRSLTGSILTWKKLETAAHSGSDALATHAESIGARAV